MNSRLPKLPENIELFDQLLILIGASLLLVGLLLLSIGIRQSRRKERKGFVYLIVGLILLVPVITYGVDYFFFTKP